MPRPTALSLCPFINRTWGRHFSRIKERGRRGREGRGVVPLVVGVVMTRGNGRRERGRGVEEEGRENEEEGGLIAVLVLVVD